MASRFSDMGDDAGCTAPLCCGLLKEREEEDVDTASSVWAGGEAGWRAASFSKGVVDSCDRFGCCCFVALTTEDEGAVVVAVRSAGSTCAGGGGDGGETAIRFRFSRWRSSFASERTRTMMENRGKKKGRGNERAKRDFLLTPFKPKWNLSD